ncbi:unnamed protein product [Prunus armeniaca]
MEKAYWCKYSKPSSNNTSWPLADGWEDGSSSEVFTLDMLEEHHLGNSFGQQETAAITFHNLSEAEKSVMEGYLGLKQGPTASQVLQRNPKVKSLFDQLGFGPQAREVATVALMNISAKYSPRCFTTSLTKIWKFPSISLSKIVQSQTSISSFRNKCEVTIGYVQINLKVGPIRSLTKFYEARGFHRPLSPRHDNVDVAYHALLERPWLNKHKLVVSTYHQCVKGRIGMRPIRAGSNPSKTFGTYLPSSIEIRDLSNDELITIVDRERKMHSELNNLAYA